MDVFNGFFMGIPCDCMLWQGADSEIWKTWSEDEPKGLLEWWNFGVWDDVASNFNRFDYSILTPCSLIFVQVHIVYIDCIHVFDYFSHTPTTIFQTYWMTTNQLSVDPHCAWIISYVLQHSYNKRPLDRYSLNTLQLYNQIWGGYTMIDIPILRVIRYCFQ